VFTFAQKSTGKDGLPIGHLAENIRDPNVREYFCGVAYTCRWNIFLSLLGLKVWP
jgi:hypothetical protein